MLASSLRLRLPALVVAVGLAAGCAVAPHTPETGVLWVAEATEYEAAVRQAYAVAERRLAALAEGRAPGSWAVVLDVDETVLSNVQYEVEIQSRGESFTEGSWRAWCLRREATVLPGALDFLAAVRSTGGKIVLVTNRRPDVEVATAENLRAVGVDFDALLPEADGGDKNPRFRAIADGEAAPGLGPLEIVMWIGDNIHDFPHLAQGAGPSALDPFGDRFVILPNPMYGSWL